jgi:hypothetical protein
MEDAHTEDVAQFRKHRADPGRRHMVWLDPSDPDGAYDAIMTMVNEAGAATDQRSDADDAQPL